MCSLLFWRISVDIEQVHRNIDDRVNSASLRISNSVQPLVYNILQKSTQRRFTEETASAILDAELATSFISAVKVFGNFGHLFMGKYKTAQGELEQVDASTSDKLQALVSIRTPVKQGSMTIGHVEVYYSYDAHKAELNKIILQEVFQIALFTLLTLLLVYLVRKSWMAKDLSERANSELKTIQQQLLRSEQLLKEANLSLEDKVHSRTKELKSINEQLVEANKAADSASKAKSLFLANMSHEIRTPMNGVIGLTELLMRTKLNKEQHDYLERLRYSSKHLLHIINDILDFSKIEAGKFSIEHTEFNFLEMLESVIHTAKLKANEKGLALNLTIDKHFSPTVLGDSVRCAQVISNLLINAVKFTDKGSIDIDIERAAESDYVDISISDTGIGISEEHQEKLFSAFTQADESTSRKYGGTGLGLVICKHLVTLMNGEIKLDSTPGKGSTFSFNLFLPLAEKTPTADAHFDRQQSEQTLTEQKHSEQKTEPKTSDFISPLLLNKHVLLVEDVPLNRLIAQSLLEQAGLHVDWAGDGLEATEKAQATQYDLIVMDIQMPVMDGFEATKIIRGYPEYKDTPIIAMTANAMSDDKEKSLEAGMDSHLTKPIQFEQVISELERFFK